MCSELTTGEAETEMTAAGREHIILQFWGYWWLNDVYEHDHFCIALRSRQKDQTLAVCDNSRVRKYCSITSTVRYIAAASACCCRQLCGVIYRVLCACYLIGWSLSYANACCGPCTGCCRPKLPVAFPQTRLPSRVSKHPCSSRIPWQRRNLWTASCLCVKHFVENSASSWCAHCPRAFPLHPFKFPKGLPDPVIDSAPQSHLF